MGDHRTRLSLQRHVAAGDHTQNRDTEAIQLKLDELIRATKGAHNALLDLEELEEETLEAFRKKYESLARAARAELRRGVRDTGTPEP